MFVLNNASTHNRHFKIGLIRAKRVGGGKAVFCCFVSSRLEIQKIGSIKKSSLPDSIQRLNAQEKFVVFFLLENENFSIFQVFFTTKHHDSCPS
jgi:hypothetical protein